MFSYFKIYIFFLKKNNVGCYTAGVYGNNCSITCPVNCKDRACHIENGTCFECMQGWTGSYCKSGKMTYHQIVFFTVSAAHDVHLSSLLKLLKCLMKIVLLGN